MKLYDLTIPVDIEIASTKKVVDSDDVTQATATTADLGESSLGSSLGSKSVNVSKRFSSTAASTVRIEGGCLVHCTQYDSIHTPYWRKSESLHSLSVRWSGLEIHYHTMVMGDNPSCSAGLPVAIQWNADSHQVIKLDDFEADRGFRRRNRVEMMIPIMQRYDLVRQAGFSRLEMKDAEKEIKKIQKQRNRSRGDVLVSDIVDKLRRKPHKSTWDHGM